ncbi:hypothetical protein Scep_016973 [Stephania cephalantha]|uniref:Uncharacterized protein n=1 Tax=Stephania cephalantha TaxID=152367 RepID=A0AAP0IP72_9MAGN
MEVLETKSQSYNSDLESFSSPVTDLKSWWSGAERRERRRERERKKEKEREKGN